MNVITKASLVCCVAVLAGISNLIASVPQLINAQGKLTDGAGNPLPNNNYEVTFTIYSAPTGGDVKWTETNPSVAVSNGQFNVLLGSINPISDTVFGGSIRYLGIKVGTDPEMIPRSRLASVGYSQTVATLDGASGGIVNGPLTVDIGEANSSRFEFNRHELSLRGFVGTDGIDRLPYIDWRSPDGTRAMYLGWGNGSSSPKRVELALENDFDLYIGGGSVGIGTSDPQGQLHVNGSAIVQQLYFGWDSPHPYLRHDYVNHNTVIADDNSTFLEVNHATGLVVIPVQLRVDGTTTTKILEITGGSDVAEPFETSGSLELQVGSVVVIDDENPGMLKLSHAAYDTRVAGVISGAGGVKPGLTLRQEGSLDQGQNIALSGRVYVLATTANGPICSGDLLTTSDVAGYAMKATDRERWSGAVIGKAMTALENGEGLVLVLVNLQ